MFRIQRRHREHGHRHVAQHGGWREEEVQRLGVERLRVGRGQRLVRVLLHDGEAVGEERDVAAQGLQPQVLRQLALLRRLLRGVGDARRGYGQCGEVYV